MPKSAIEYEETHTKQRDAKYRANFIINMKDRIRTMITEFGNDKSIKVTIRVEDANDSET